MSDVIGIDPVDLEGLVDQVVSQHKAEYDALDETAKLKFREVCRAQMQVANTIAEQTRLQTIDQVLAVFDLAATTQNIPFIRDAIVRFKKV